MGCAFSTPAKTSAPSRQGKGLKLGRLQAGYGQTEKSTAPKGPRKAWLEGERGPWKETIKGAGQVGGQGQEQAEGNRSPAVKVKSLTAEAIKKMTGRFSKAHLLGAGPTGDVFRGIWEGQVVAVKRSLSSSQTSEHFLEEVALIRMFRHPNVVQLLAYCCTPACRAFVLEYAPLGSLSSLLHGKKGEAGPAGAPLTWSQRLNVLRGAALGLAYLHDSVESLDSELVHQRVKSSNVLVFPGHVGKIADCRLQSQDQDSMLLESSMPLGNFASEAPESFTGELTQKTDVYSFGIVMLEALSGRKPTTSIGAMSGSGRPQSLKEWAMALIEEQRLRDLLDPNLDITLIEDKKLSLFCSAVKTCLDVDPVRRPVMRQVAKFLQKQGASRDV